MTYCKLYCANVGIGVHACTCACVGLQKEKELSPTNNFYIHKAPVQGISQPI